MKAAAATEIAATELTAAYAELSGNAELTASNAELTAANAELTATTVELTATTAELHAQKWSTFQNLREGQLETTHANAYRVGHYHTKHCHAAVVSLGGLTHR